MPRKSRLEKITLLPLNLCRICLHEIRLKSFDVFGPNEPHLLQRVKEYFKVEVSTILYVVRACLSRFIRICPPLSRPADICLYRHWRRVDYCRFLYRALAGASNIVAHGDLCGPLCCCVIFASAAVHVHVVGRFMLLQR